MNLRNAAPGVPPGAAAVVADAMTTSGNTTRLGLTVSQAAEELGVSIATVRRWSNAGHLQGTRTPGGQRRFTQEQLDAFMASLRTGPRASTSD